MNSNTFHFGHHLLAGAAVLLLGGAAASAQGLREGDVDTGWFGNVAIEGFDPVAYFTAGAPMQGSPAISAEWLGAEWHFVSSEHRDMFLADPTSYAPQYGGHCADGLAYTANSVTINIDPLSWRIINGKLYIAYDPVSIAEFAETEGFIDKADANWASFQAAHGMN